MTSIGHETRFDGTRIVFTATQDNTTATARIAVGSHTNAEHDAVVTKLRTDYATLRQWSLDAAATNTNWPTMTAVQKDNATRETIRRLGIMLDRMGDLLVYLNADA